MISQYFSFVVFFSLLYSRSSSAHSSASGLSTNSSSKSSFQGTNQNANLFTDPGSQFIGPDLCNSSAPVEKGDNSESKFKGLSYQNIGRNSAYSSQSSLYGLNIDTFQNVPSDVQSSSGSNASLSRKGSDIKSDKNGSISSFDELFGKGREFVEDWSTCAGGDSGAGDKSDADNEDDSPTIDQKTSGNGDFISSQNNYSNVRNSEGAATKKSPSHTFSSNQGHGPRQFYNSNYNNGSQNGFNKRGPTFPGPPQFRPGPTRGFIPHIPVPRGQVRQEFRFGKGGFPIPKYGYDQGAQNKTYQNSKNSFANNSASRGTSSGFKRGARNHGRNFSGQQSPKTDKTVYEKHRGGKNQSPKPPVNLSKNQGDQKCKLSEKVQYSKGGTLEDIESNFIPDPRVASPYTPKSSQPVGGAGSNSGFHFNVPDLFSGLSSKVTVSSLDSVDDLTGVENQTCEKNIGNLTEIGSSEVYEEDSETKVNNFISGDTLGVPAGMFTDSIKNYYN